MGFEWQLLRADDHVGLDSPRAEQLHQHCGALQAQSTLRVEGTREIQSAACELRCCVTWLSRPKRESFYLFV
jgi:hypothetical protein